MIYGVRMIAWLRRVLADLSARAEARRAIDLHESCRHRDVGACGQCRADDWADRTV